MSVSAITDWSAVSPFGIGRAAFVAGLRAGGPAISLLAPPAWNVPEPSAYLVPDFDPRTALGAKGTRAMDRGTGLAIAAMSELFHPERCGPAGTLSERTAIVLGTTTGSADSMMEFTRTSLLAERPFYIDPARMAYAVMNGAAGNCAIRYQIKGPNTTVAAGRGSGFAALLYGQRLLAAQRAVRVLCGATEEVSAARLRLEFHSRTGTGHTPLSEGSAFVMLEPAATSERPALAHVLAVGSRAVSTAGPDETLHRCVSHVLTQAGLIPSDVWAVLPGAVTSPETGVERDVLTAVFREEAFGRVPSATLLGDAGATTALFQVAIVLATVEITPGLAGKIVLASGVDRDGVVSCAVLRIGGNP